MFAKFPVVQVRSQVIRPHLRLDFLYLFRSRSIFFIGNRKVWAALQWKASGSSKSRATKSMQSDDLSLVDSFAEIRQVSFRELILCLTHSAPVPARSKVTSHLKHDL